MYHEQKRLFRQIFRRKYLFKILKSVAGGEKHFNNNFQFEKSEIEDVADQRSADRIRAARTRERGAQ
jgi:hypothetical protein